MFSICRSEHVESLVNIASDIDTSPETLDELSRNENYEVRWYVANNPNTTPETLDYLSRDIGWGVRWRVAKHPNTTPETLKQMSIDEEDNYIKAYIKINPNCSKETYKYLCAVEILNSLTTVH